MQWLTFHEDPMNSLSWGLHTTTTRHYYITSYDAHDPVLRNDIIRRTWGLYDCSKAAIAITFSRLGLLTALPLFIDFSKLYSVLLFGDCKGVSIQIANNS